MSQPDRDVLDLLRRLGTVDPQQLSGPGDPEVDALLDRIVATPTDVAPTARPVRRRTVAVLLAAALGLIAATTYLLVTRDVTEPTSIGCYREATMDADVIVTAAGTGPSATEVCRQLWEEGAFAGTQTPEHLTECVLPTGVLAVFPAEDCDDVEAPREQEEDPAPSEPATGDPTPPDDPPPPDDPGRRPLPPGSTDHEATAEQIQAVSDELVDRMLAQDCPDPERTADDVRDVLADGALPGWELEIDDRFDETMPCASLAFDTEQRRIIITPVG